MHWRCLDSSSVTNASAPDRMVSLVLALTWPSTIGYLEGLFQSASVVSNKFRLWCVTEVLTCKDLAPKEVSVGGAFTVHCLEFRFGLKGTCTTSTSPPDSFVLNEGENYPWLFPWSSSFQRIHTPSLIYSWILFHFGHSIENDPQIVTSGFILSMKVLWMKLSN